MPDRDTPVECWFCKGLFGAGCVAGVRGVSCFLAAARRDGFFGRLVLLCWCGGLRTQERVLYYLNFGTFLVPSFIASPDAARWFGRVPEGV